MTLYNDFVRARFHSHNPPVKDLLADIVEYEDGYLTLRLYRSNYNEYPERDRMRINLWVNSVMEDLSKIVPISLEVFP